MAYDVCRPAATLVTLIVGENSLQEIDLWPEPGAML